MYVKYCENKPKSEYIVAEYLDSYFEASSLFLDHRNLILSFTDSIDPNFTEIKKK